MSTKVCAKVIEAFIIFVNRTSNEALDEIKKTVRKREEAKKIKFRKEVK